jgi:Mg-chelatase subunit ChlD
MRLTPLPHRLPLPILLATATSLAAVLLLAALAQRDPAPAAAQSGLREAYKLVDTWDGVGLQSAPGAVLYPAGIDATVDSVYVVDRGNDRIEVFDPSDDFRLAWGRRGSEMNELMDPQDVAVDGNRVYVTDRGNGRVMVYTPEGSPVAAWTAPGLAAPWGITARGGRVYVTSPETGEVIVFTDGAVTARWSAPTATDPRGIDVGPDGRVYVADPTASAVFVFSADGKLQSTLSQPNRDLAPRDVAVDDTGDLYVQSHKAILWHEAGETASRQAMYRDDLQGVTIVPQRRIYATVASDARQMHGVLVYPWRPRANDPTDDWPFLGYPPGRFNAPHAIHAGADHRIWVLDGWPRLQSFDADGTPRDQLAPSLTPQRLFEPVDIAGAANGELLVGETSWLTRFKPDGTISNTVRLRLGTTSVWLTALALQDDGRRATWLDSSSVTAREVGITRTVQQRAIWPLDRGGPGWVYFSDLAAPLADPSVPPGGPPDRVFAVNRSARTIGVYDNKVLVATWPVDGIPARVATGPGKSVFVLTTDGVVSKLAADGTVIAAWDAGAFSAASSEVTDLTVDTAGRVYTVDRAANTVRIWDIDPGATPEPPLVRRGACRVRGDKRAAPASVQVNNPVTVTLEVGGDCPSAKPGADIILAIDRSFSMAADNKITDTIRAATAFIDAIDLNQDRVGVVAFDNSASLVQPLTADRAAAKAAVARLRPLGATNIAAAIQIAADELAGPRGRPAMQPVLVLLTDGKDDYPDKVIAAAAALKARGARIFTISFGDIDPMVMIRTASSPEESYYAPDSTTLDAIYSEIARRLTASVLARTMTIVDQLPADMRYVAAVAGPAPTVAGQTLTWNLTDVSLAGLTLAYTVRPQQLGLRPTNIDASAEFQDGLDRAGRLRFPVPQVDVLGLPPTATRTPTRFPTQTPRPTNTATPTDTPTPPPAIYLPITLRQRCEDENIRADVAIVMDTSGSMLLPARADDPNHTRLAAAVDAAKKSVDILLALVGNRVAIVSFNEAAAIVQPLTGDRAALLAALDGLTTFQGTRIDLGLQRATEALTGPDGNPANNRVLVLLTDGRASGVDNATVLATADQAKAAYIRVFTIGMGSAEDIDAELLRAVASRPEYYYPAPDAAGLAAIYEQIAYTIKCVNLAWP